MRQDAQTKSGGGVAATMPAQKPVEKQRFGG
jgi:hypothetical protein